MSSIVQLEAGAAHIGDLDQLLKETQMSALRLLEAEDYAEALKRFTLNERVLEEAKKQDVNADPDFVLATLHNIACCHQTLRNTEDSASYLEACLYNLKTVSRQSDANSRFKLRKYECRARVQLCALLSQVGRHEAALSHARLGMKLAHSILLDVLLLCKEHIARHKKLAAPVRAEAYRKSHELVKTALPLLLVLQNRLSHTKGPAPAPQKLETRSALGVQHYSDWIYSLDIGEVMTIQPITLRELKNKLETYKELTRDSLLDKVCLLIASLFCLATEMRLMYGEDNDQRLREAQGFHKKALLIARDVLPLETPLLEHLEVSYQKHFAVLDTSRLNRLETSLSRLRNSRLGKLDTSLNPKSPLSAKSLLTSTLKPRSSSAKGTRKSIRPTPAKPKTPAPHLKRKSPDKVVVPFTDRGITPDNWTRRNPREKTLTPLRITKRRADDEEDDKCTEEFMLSSADLYGADLSERHVECSIDIRDDEDNSRGKMKDSVRVMSCTGGN